MTALSVTTMSVDALKANPRNARTHSPKQIRQIANSLEQFGFINPILLDRDGVIIAGHGRLEAAKQLGLSEVPTIRVNDLSPDQVRAYAIADNRLAELAGWDTELLGTELAYLADLDIDFDPTITGFEMAKIDLLIGDLGDGSESESTDPDDSVPETSRGPAVTQPGDIWVIGGQHRLICGDATKPETYDRLLIGDQARMVFTDPPYNVPIDGHVCGLGSIRHREFAMASGEMTSPEFEAFLTTVLTNLAGASTDGAIHYVCMDWRHMREILGAGHKAYTELKNLCVWNKSNGGMGSLYRSKHELVFVFKNGTGQHINNVDLGRYGRYRSNVWDYAGANALSPSRQDDLAMHPTVKPVALVADAILDTSNRADIVLDAFAGSGTTLVAAARTGRRGYGIEIDPLYCDIIIRRLAKTHGFDTVNDDTGLSFSESEAVMDQQSMEAADVR